MEEWQFICGEDRRWFWELRENGKLVQCSLGIMESETRCIKDARLHGYSPMFCRHREIRFDQARAEQQRMNDWSGIAHAAKELKPPKGARRHPWLIAAVALAVGVGLSVAVWLSRSLTRFRRLLAWFPRS